MTRSPRWLKYDLSLAFRSRLSIVAPQSTAARVNSIDLGMFLRVLRVLRVLLPVVSTQIIQITISILD